MVSGGADCSRATATSNRSARRQTVRATCNSALRRVPPGSTKLRRAGRPAFIASISRSSCTTSAGVTRGCRGCVSISGSVARMEPRLNSSCCTRRREWRPAARALHPLRKRRPPARSRRSAHRRCRKLRYAARLSDSLPPCWPGLSRVAALSIDAIERDAQKIMEGLFAHISMGTQMAAIIADYFSTMSVFIGPRAPSKSFFSFSPTLNLSSAPTRSPTNASNCGPVMPMPK